jgi:ferric-dicitrate binding protein FerR (iron transport regulator)
MEYRDERLDEIGGRIRDLLAVDPEANEELRRGRIALLEEVERRNAASSLRRPSRPSSRPWLPLIFAASCAAGAAGVWLSTRPVTFQVGEARVGHLGDVVESADGKATTPLHFSDGSTVLLHEGGRVRVLSLKAGAARVLVEDGVIDASIAQRKLGKTRWDFEAGPYRVTVNGTRFRMAFHASDDSFSLSTQEGQVVVSGGCQKTPKTVSAGERMELSCAPREAPRPWADSASVMEMPPAPAERDPAPSGRMQSDRWRGLLAAGRLSQGLSAAERVGFERVCQMATPKELLALADAGRFYGSYVRAQTALRVLRQRFPGSMDAGTAAFTLGRIAFEKQHTYAEAAGWFEIYLREQPSGPLMGDAFGRLMEAKMRSGDHEGARANAQQYLRRFPEGPYASEARGVLSR